MADNIYIRNSREQYNKLQKRLKKKEEIKKKRILNDKKMPKRMLFLLLGIVILFMILIGQFAKLQLIEGSKLKEKARNQQLLKKRIGAKRGNILDRNGEVLAQSVEVDTVTVNPKLLRGKRNKEINKEEFAQAIEKIFSIKKEETLEKINSNKDVVTIAPKVEKDKIHELEEVLKKMEITAGVNIDKDIKRIYPYSSVASNIIGFVREDNVGQEGLEKKLDSTLTGREGRIVSQSDVHRNLTKENPEQLIKAEDGKNVYLTIDIKMQTMVEKYLKEAVKHNNARDGMALVMSPKTGEVLAMANEPTYDLNNPRTPINITKEEWDKLNENDKMDRLYGRWKNKPITDVYDPGSTFKLITSAMGLEEGVTTPDKPGDFYCSGVQRVYDREIKCWRFYNPHGAQTLRQALENSCNPAFIQLGQRLGVNKFYKYLHSFGLTERTGIDLLGESNSIMHKESSVGPVELATLSFGQRFQVTPIQLITAISALANEGKLLVPQIVHKVENTENGSQQITEKKEVRQVVSKETSKQILDMMKSVVVEGTGKNAGVPGYNVGGKSGTSEPAEGAKGGEYVASFVAVVPTENPEYVVLMILRDPKGKSIQGGQIVAPVVGQILKEILVDSKLAKKQNAEDQTAQVKSALVKSVVDKTVAEATEILKTQGLEVVVKNNKTPEETKVGVQNPKPGTKLEPGSKVYLTNAGEETDKVTLPELKGMNIDQIKQKLKSLDLNYTLSGTEGVAMIQNPSAGAIVEKGAVINITIKPVLREAH